MKTEKKKAYRSYRREFRQLRDSGCRLCYPYDREIGPSDLAETIVRDAGATYMRDVEYDREGRQIRIHFTRVSL